jgi:hypothetical protein
MKNSHLEFRWKIKEAVALKKTTISGATAPFNQADNSTRLSFA